MAKKIETKKSAWGGARAGAGRKKGEPQTVISFKAVSSFVEMLDKKRGDMSRPAFIKMLVEKAK